MEKHWQMQYEFSPPKSMIFNIKQRQKAAVRLFSIPNWLAHFWMSVLSEYLVVQLALLLIEELHLLHWTFYFPGKVSHSFLPNLSIIQAQISLGFLSVFFFLWFSPACTPSFAFPLLLFLSLLFPLPPWLSPPSLSSHFPLIFNRSEYLLS